MKIREQGFLNDQRFTDAVSEKNPGMRVRGEIFCGLASAERDPELQNGSPMRSDREKNRKTIKRLVNRTIPCGKERQAMQTEKEFLSQYKISDYERPSMTADVAAFMIRSEETGNYKRDAESRLSILLVRRGGHPFRGCWALPGGFLKPAETIEECAFREITEEANVKPAALLPVGIFSDPGRDPRGWIVSCAYASIISEESVQQAGGDDASDAQWFDVWYDRGKDGYYHLDLRYRDTELHAVLSEIKTSFKRTLFEIKDSGGLAFDHARIIATALTVLRENAGDYETIFDFLPEKFTLTALQKVQETIMNISILPANFRRKVSDYVTETDEYTQGTRHRPAKLYRRKEREI
jgi:ADP-ribose pyrophosphatase YjhB (NUDIX family)